MPEHKRPRMADSIAGSPYIRSHASSDELISYMAARGSKIKELEESVAALTAENEQLKYQLKDKDYKLESAEAEVKIHSVVKKSEADGAAATVQQLEKLLQQEMAKSHKLDLQLDQKQQQLESAQQQTRTLTDQLLASQSGSTDATSGLEKQVRSLQRQLQAATSEHQEQVHQLQLALRAEKSKREAAADSTRVHKEQLEQARQNIKSLQQAKGALQLQLAEAQATAASASALSAAAGGDADTQFLVSTLQKELKSQEAEIQEARRIKRHMENINILKDQLHSAKMRAADADKVITEAHELRIHAERLQQELDQWHKLFPGSSGSPARPDPAAVAQMQQDALNSRQNLAQKEGEVKKLNQQVKELQEGAEKLTREATDMRSEAANAARLLAIAERRLGLLGRERDSLKKIMDVVEQEPLAAGAGGEQQLAEAVARLAQQRERCRMLEEKQQELDAQVEDMHKAMAELAASEREQRQVAQAAAVRADDAEQLSRQLEREVTDLGNQVAVLQNKLGAGEYDKSSSKVLHFIRNPEAEYYRLERDMRVEQLEAENGALRDNIASLEAQAAQGGEAGSAGGLSLAVKDAELMVAKRRSSELEKQLDRLKAVFKDRIGVFREACALLFGYRVDMTSEPSSSQDPSAASTIISLHPLLETRSRGSEAVLSFKLSKAKGIRLVPTPYSDSLRKQVETFLSKYKSVPAFTANLTMELFNQGTQA